MKTRLSLLWSVALLIGVSATALAAEPPIGVPVPPLGAGPWVIDTAEQHGIRLSVVTKGLSHPWAIAFLPNGDLLITERAGRLRLVRNGVLDPRPIAGVPTRAHRRQRRPDGCGAASAVRDAIASSISRIRSRWATAWAHRRSRAAGSKGMRSST